jgi:mannitol/fructose-specific phosphotransferase system IIA component (Ntr-type)
MKNPELLNYFHEDLFLPELKSSKREDLLKEMVDYLAAKEKISNTALIYDLVKKREDLGSTGIGDGIAIPHCRSIAVEKLTVLCALKSKGVAFKSPDDKPVKLFFLVVAPPQDINYLVFLGKLVEILTDKKIKKGLFNITSFQEFTDLISGVT